MYQLVENLELRFDEIADRIAQQTGRTVESAKAEVSTSIRRLFYWAAYADKYGGEVQETSFYGATVKVHEPVGTVGNFDASGINPKIIETAIINAKKIKPKTLATQRLLKTALVLFAVRTQMVAKEYAKVDEILKLTDMDEISDIHNLKIKTYVNDELRQDSCTDQLIFDCFDLIEHITKAFTLEPGDIIATGTSSGVGVVLGKYLVPNDVVRIELENVGTLENKVILEP